MLKYGPDFLKYIPGEKVGDLRVWLESYRFWNQVNCATRTATSFLKKGCQNNMKHFWLFFMHHYCVREA